jgi:FixJ family two-component response regulator
MQRVLLVDNDSSLRRALVRTLRRAGFDVQAFASAETLLASGSVSDGACLVLDVDLPGAGGVALKQALAGSGYDLPTVFITASAREGLPAQLAALSPVDVLYKPFRNETLLEALARACPRGSAPDIESRR